MDGLDNGVKPRMEGAWEVVGEWRGGGCWGGGLGLS